MPHSHHSHSGQFCSHAKDSLSSVLHRAHSLGFTHFHLSEHVPRAHTSELYPEELQASLTPSTLRSTFAAYLVEARRLQAEYARQGSLHVLVGCETENITSPGSLDYLTEILGGDEKTKPEQIGSGKVDYIVGSLHHTHSIPIDFDRDTFDRCLSTFTPVQTAHSQLIQRYLDDQLEVLHRLKPEVVGHLDLFRLFTPSLEIEDDQIWAKIERNVKFAVSYGALFECNAAAFRKGWSTSYPAKDVLDVIVRQEGRLCLSDDSHGVQAVGGNYLRLKEYLVDAGVERVWYLEKDEGQEKEEAVDGRPSRFARGTVARMMGNEWKDHPFWSKFAASLESET